MSWLWFMGKALRSSFRNCEVNLATTIPIFGSPLPDSLGVEPNMSLCVPYNDSQFNPCLLSGEQKDLTVPRLPDTTVPKLNKNENNLRVNAFLFHIRVPSKTASIAARNNKSSGRVIQTNPISVLAVSALVSRTVIRGRLTMDNGCLHISPLVVRWEANSICAAPISIGCSE